MCPRLQRPSRSGRSAAAADFRNTAGKIESFRWKIIVPAIKDFAAAAERVCAADIGSWPLCKGLRHEKRLREKRLQLLRPCQHNRVRCQLRIFLCGSPQSDGFARASRDLHLRGADQIFVQQPRARRQHVNPGIILAHDHRPRELHDGIDRRQCGQRLGRPRSRHAGQEERLHGADRTLAVAFVFQFLGEGAVFIQRWRPDFGRRRNQNEKGDRMAALADTAHDLFHHHGVPGAVFAGDGNAAAGTDRGTSRRSP